jgi:hypothetical protein
MTEAGKDGSRFARMSAHAVRLQEWGARCDQNNMSDDSFAI